MRKFYFAFAALIAGGMITLGGNTISAQNIVKKCHRPRVMMKNMPTTMIERMPQVEETYGWSGTDWVLSSKSLMKYDGDMLLEKKSDVYNEGSVLFTNRDTYKYNADGLQTECVSESSYDSGDTWDKVVREVRGYDTVRKDALILDEFYNWDGYAGDWYLDEENEEGFFLELERDADGRVTKATRWLNSGKPIALAAHEFTYNDEVQKNGAAGMAWYALDENYELSPAYIYENMTWLETDNQYVNILPNVYYPFDTDVNNKLVGYDIYAANPDGTKGDLDAGYKSVYDENGRIYYVEINFGDGGQYQCLYAYDKDENGSYEYNEIISRDLDGSGKIDFPDEYIMGNTVVTCNSYGDIVLEEMYDVDASMTKTLTEGYGYDMVYDEEGLLTELTLTYYTTMVEGGSWEKLSKLVYSDYTDGTTTGMAKAEEGKAGVSLVNDNLCFSNARGARYIVTDMSGKTLAHGIVNADKISVGNLPGGMYIVKISGNNCNNAVKLIKK